MADTIATDELMTVQAFATKFGVDVSVVRSWVKNGYIPYELVGPRCLRRIRPSTALRPVGVSEDRTTLTAFLMGTSNLDQSTAAEVVTGLTDTEVTDMLKEMQSGTAERPHGMGEGSTPTGADQRTAPQAGRNPKRARRA